MAHPWTSQEKDSSAQSDKSPTAPTVDTAGFETAFTEAGGAAVAALLHLLRLMGAELVLMRPDCDPTRFEQAVRTKIEQFPSPTANEHAREAGLAHARHLVEQVLLQIRAQAELKKNLGASAGRGQPTREASATSSTSPRANFLN
jgi:hypothetical protein